MSLKFSLALALCLSAVVLSERVRFDNYRVYKVSATTKPELAILKDLEGSSDSIMFFDEIHFLNREMDVLVAPHKVPDFLQLLDENKIDHKLIDIDFQSTLYNDDDEIARSTNANASSDYNWKQYYELDDNYNWLSSLAALYPNVVTLIKGGKTYEGRSILGVKISYPTASNKAGILIESGIHAREWIAPATATYIINQLLTSSDRSIKKIAKKYDWYIFPHLNPDGYVYTHTTNRLWRKTRSKQGICYGADPNRNWDNHWNEIEKDNEKCSETYPGASAFSEIETRTFANYLSTLRGKIQLYLSFHSFSQLLLFPYGYTSTLPDNYADLKSVYDVTVAAIKKRYKTKYTGGNIYKGIYPVSGSSIDWVYDDLNIKMAFCFELRPTREEWIPGFMLPESEIIPTAEETLDGIVAMIVQVDKLGYFDV